MSYLRSKLTHQWTINQGSIYGVVCNCIWTAEFVKAKCSIFVFSPISSMSYQLYILSTLPMSQENPRFILSSLYFWQKELHSFLDVPLPISSKPFHNFLYPSIWYPYTLPNVINGCSLLKCYLGALHVSHLSLKFFNRGGWGLWVWTRDL